MFLLFLWPLQYWGLTKLHPIVMPVWVSEHVSRGRYIFVLSSKSICRLRTTFHCTPSEINERETDRQKQRETGSKRGWDRVFSGGCSISCINEALYGFQTDGETSLHPSFPSSEFMSLLLSSFTILFFRIWWLKSVLSCCTLNTLDLWLFWSVFWLWCSLILSVFFTCQQYLNHQVLLYPES